jgi:hypothetical protein
VSTDHLCRRAAVTAPDRRVGVLRPSTVTGTDRPFRRAGSGGWNAGRGTSSARERLKTRSATWLGVSPKCPWRRAPGEGASYQHAAWRDGRKRNPTKWAPPVGLARYSSCMLCSSVGRLPRARTGDSSPGPPLPCCWRPRRVGRSRHSPAGASSRRVRSSSGVKFHGAMIWSPGGGRVRAEGPEGELALASAAAAPRTRRLQACGFSWFTDRTRAVPLVSRR